MSALVIAGSLMIAAVMLGFMGLTVWTAGWRMALQVWAFSLGATAIVAGGGLLIGYGMEAP